MVLIIAEIGVNHNGCLDTAKKLIDVAASSGADVVKFQTFKADQLTTEIAPLADYQLKNSPELINQQTLLSKLELDENGHKILKNYSHSVGIEFALDLLTAHADILECPLADTNSRKRIVIQALSLITCQQGRCPEHWVATFTRTHIPRRLPHEIWTHFTP